MCAENGSVWAKSTPLPLPKAAACGWKQSPRGPRFGMSLAVAAKVSSPSGPWVLGAAPASNRDCSSFRQALPPKKCLSLARQPHLETYREIFNPTRVRCGRDPYYNVNIRVV